MARVAPGIVAPPLCDLIILVVLATVMGQVAGSFYQIASPKTHPARGARRSKWTGWQPGALSAQPRHRPQRPHGQGEECPACETQRQSSPRVGEKSGAPEAMRRTGVGGTQRFKEPVPAEGPIVRQIRRAPRVFNARMAREVDAGSCEQSGVRQSVAGIVVGEKNRCIRISAPGAGSIAVRRQSSELAGTISGTIEGTVGGRVSRDLVYT